MDIGIPSPEIQAGCRELSTPALQGHILSGIVYGLATAFAGLSVQLIWATLRSPKTRSRQDVMLILYVSTVFILSTIAIAGQSIEMQDFVMYPQCVSWAGPYAVLGKIGGACFVLLNWCTDGLLIWRCIVIYQDSKFPRWILFLLFTTLSVFSLGMGLLLMVTTLEQRPKDTFLVVQGAISLGINVIFTGMILGRLFVYRRWVIGALGPNHGVHYTSVMALVSESAVLVVVFSTAMLVLLVKLSLSAVIPLQILLQIQASALAPLWIIYRVAKGKAWDARTSSEISRAIQFTPPQTEFSDDTSTIRSAS
ncbi:hypothetical protein BDQ12DRAFT_730967 [Crucibulum laeve]|uniref:Uncharacterized protein n=1 Tax=Crucibulum laeve TaxID=68775 RepID=A0A5C3MKT4_9AGAR|nr:hypothetical protein BDQ12DRAFT_730967 [Crucibulum laeve]